MYKYIPPQSQQGSASETTTTRTGAGPRPDPRNNLPLPLPLVVLIPGGAHNGRIYYGGHEGHNPADYLSFWLNKLGFPVLAISYPLESDPELMPPVSPGFRIDMWGRQAAQVTRDVIDTTPFLSGRDVLLIGWSMGGRILAPYAEAMTRVHNLHVGLFISLAATPGVAGMRPPPPGITKSQAGYAGCDGLLDMFVGQIRKTTIPREVIPEQVFRTEYYGHSPVSLHGWRRSYHPSTGEFVYDRWGSEEDASPTDDDFSVLPWMATIVGTDSEDARHVLADRVAWENLSVQRLTSMWEKRHKPSLQKKQDLKKQTTRDDQQLPSVQSNSSDTTTAKQGSDCAATSTCQPRNANGVVSHTSTQYAERALWHAYSSFVHEVMPGALTRRVSGNHYFFLGEDRARRTAEAVAELWIERCDLEQQLSSIMRTEEGR